MLRVLEPAFGCRLAGGVSSPTDSLCCSCFLHQQQQRQEDMDGKANKAPCPELDATWIDVTKDFEDNCSGLYCFGYEALEQCNIIVRIVS